MPAPAGYTQQANGAWLKSDQSGPYTCDAGLGSSAATTQMRDTGWWIAADGSGPYFRDVTAGTWQAIFPLGA